MAQTLIGNLVLKLQEEVSAKAKKAAGALNNLDKAAKNVGKSGSGANKLKADMEGLNAALRKMGDAPWGARLQAQFDRLGASSDKIARLRAEYLKLQSDLKNVGGNLRNNAFSAWRVGALADLAAVQAKMKDAERAARDHARAMEKAARDSARASERAARETQRAAERAARAQERTAAAMRRGLGDAMKPVYTAAGLGTGSYVTGRLASSGLRSDATVERERFRMKASGFDGGQAKALEDRAQQLAKEYGLFTGEVMEMMREASLAIPNLRDGNGKVIKTGFQSAMELAETITQFGVMMGNIHGQERAPEMTRAMMKSFDVLGINDPAVMRKAMDDYAKVNRIIGKDTDPTQMFLAAKYMRSPGKAFDPDFIYRMGAAMQAESSGGDVGTSLRALFSNTAGERRSKKASKMMADYGLLESDGTIKGADLMKNPAVWIESVLKEALAKKNVDTKDSVKVAQILSQLFDNRLSADMAQKVLEQIEQYRDTLARADNAYGLDKAKEVRQGDPFAGYEAFTKSLQNLAAASGLTGAITPALNGLADGINALGGALKGMSEADLATAGIVGGLVALKGALALGGGLAALVGAGPALMGSAAALTAAAGSLSGAGVAGKVAGAATGAAGGAAAGAAGAGVMATLKEAGSKLFPLGLLGFGLGAGLNQAQEIANQDRAAGSGPGYEGIQARAARTDAAVKAYRERQRAFQEANGIDATGARLVKPGEIASSGRRDSNASTFSAPAAPAVDTSKMDEAKAKSAETGQAIQTNLNVTATPNVVTTGFDAALQKAQQLLALIGQINSGASTAGAGIGSRVRGAQSDFGVSP